MIAKDVTMNFIVLGGIFLVVFSVLIDDLDICFDIL